MFCLDTRLGGMGPLYSLSVQLSIGIHKNFTDLHFIINGTEKKKNHAIIMLPLKYESGISAQQNGYLSMLPSEKGQIIVREGWYDWFKFSNNFGRSGGGNTEFPPSLMLHNILLKANTDGKTCQTFRLAMPEIQPRNNSLERVRESGKTANGVSKESKTCRFGTRALHRWFVLK